MKTTIKILVFLALTVALKLYGESLDMLVFGGSCSSIYGSYAFLLSFIVLVVYAAKKKRLISIALYLAVPLIGISIGYFSYPLAVKAIDPASFILFRSVYCYYLYLVFAVAAIAIFEWRKVNEGGQVLTLESHQ